MEYQNCQNLFNILDKSFNFCPNTFQCQPVPFNPPCYNGYNDYYQSPRGSQPAQRVPDIRESEAFPHSKRKRSYSYEEEADRFDFDDEPRKRRRSYDGTSFYSRSERRFQLYPVRSERVTPVGRLPIVIRDDQKFYTDDDDYIQVYTDGSFRYNGGDSFSAIGIWFGPKHRLNVSEPARLRGFNSEGAEFEAIIEAIKIARNCGIKKLQINTDCKNAIIFLHHFIDRWERNGWRNIRGLPVRNRELIRDLDFFSGLIKIKWNYIPAWAGVEGNVEADYLARSASAADMRRNSAMPPSRRFRKMARFTPY